MRFRKEKQDAVLSVIANGVEFAGDLTFDHGLRVDGLVRGKVQSEATLIIGATGKVEAEVDIRRISINGEFHGSIRASDRVEIHKDGKVYGDIFTPCLIIEAGALFEGRCNMADQMGSSTEDAIRLQPLEQHADASARRQNAAGPMLP